MIPEILGRTQENDSFVLYNPGNNRETGEGPRIYTGFLEIRVNVQICVIFCTAKVAPELDVNCTFMASFSQLQKNVHATLLEFILQGLSRLCTLKLLSSDKETAVYELPSHSRKRLREARYSFFTKRISEISAVKSFAV
jgi:hypothetical protein